MSVYHLNVTLHVLAALLWLGGMLFFAAVAAPVLRRIEPPDLRARLFQQLGEAFRAVGWVAILLLVVTGLLNLHFRGWLGPALRGDALLWSSPVGRWLRWKLIAVGVMVALGAVHDFRVGPRASRAVAGSDDAVRLRRRAAWLARVNALVGLVLVYISVRMTR